MPSRIWHLWEEAATLRDMVLIAELQNVEKLFLGAVLLQILSLAELHGIPFQQLKIKDLTRETMLVRCVLSGIIGLLQNSHGLKKIRLLRAKSYRAEFDIAKGSEDYKRLIGRYTGNYVGLTERLRSLIKILRPTGKRCLRDKKMHKGPWRKHKYMQAKWLGTCDRSSSLEAAVSEMTDPENLVKSRVSMLNYNDLLGGWSGGMGRHVTVV